MNTISGLLECVPNFSEGKDSHIINQIATTIEAIPGQRLLHIDASPSANRTVMTFAGNSAAVVEAAYQAILMAASLIDMRGQSGAHPRIGATDVCPLVPLQACTMAEAIGSAKQLAQRIGTAGIPVYLYEEATDDPYRKALPDIRKGQYEQILQKMKRPGWTPDFGFDPTLPLANYARSGATVIGARKILVAFNVSLQTRDAGTARQIASELRSSGGGLPAVRAIGWYMEQYQCAQVSMNLLDYEITSPWTAWQACRQLARKYGTAAIGCEVIGLIPESCLLEAGQNTFRSDQKNITEGIKNLGLNRVRPFAPEEKILEQVLRRKGLLT